MPEADAGSGSSGEMPSADKLEPNDVRVKGKERQQYSSRPSSSTSELDAPYPFDSQSALDAENGKRLTGTTLESRLANALGLRKGRDSSIDQIVRSLDEYSAGYGKVAAIEDLGEDFLIYRKFGWLHNYALLFLQDELSEIQEKLERLDKWEFRDGDDKLLLSRRRTYRKDDSERRELLIQLRSKLAEYDETILRTQKIQGLKQPTRRAQRNLHRLIENTGSLVEDESSWTRELPDLAALGRGPEYSWLNTFFEDTMNRISRKATVAIFRSKEQRLKTGKETLQLIAAERFDVLVRVALTLIAALLLLVPVSVLFKLQPTSQADYHRNGNYQILTVFLFTLLFSASCSLFTKANRHEVFAATAGYSAVLVVFLGNTSNVMLTQNSK